MMEPSNRGERGEPGQTGRTGETGPAGEGAPWTNRRISVSFWVVVIVSVVMVSYLGYELQTVRNLGSENRQRIADDKALLLSLAQFQRDTKRELKLSDERQVETIRTILCFGAAQVQSSKQRTPEEKAAAAEYYSDTLKLIDARPCD